PQKKPHGRYFIEIIQQCEEQPSSFFISSDVQIAFIFKKIAKLSNQITRKSLITNADSRLLKP
ncbi:MAG: hypothetical protein ACPHUC_04210, partial [Psychrobacter celer]